MEKLTKINEALSDTLGRRLSADNKRIKESILVQCERKNITSDQDAIATLTVAAVEGVEQAGLYTVAGDAYAVFETEEPALTEILAAAGHFSDPPTEVATGLYDYVIASTRKALSIVAADMVEELTGARPTASAQSDTPDTEARQF